MRAVIQRADGASVVVAGRVTASFAGEGLVVLLGVTHQDGEPQARRMARKVADLRLLRGERSAVDAGAPIVVISQFTLYGDARKGRRPTWNAAAPGPVAEPLVARVVALLRERGLEVGEGVFGADMAVALTNDGPVTLVLDVD
jgi:D-tyrosyl-tRNA(Tyr) deacylase